MALKADGSLTSAVKQHTCRPSPVKKLKGGDDSTPHPQSEGWQPGNSRFIGLHSFQRAADSYHVSNSSLSTAANMLGCIHQRLVEPLEGASTHTHRVCQVTSTYVFAQLISESSRTRKLDSANKAEH